MLTVKDVIIRKPTEDEKNRCSQWPTWSHEPEIFDWVYTEKEICLLIKGKVTVSDKTSKVSFAAGDLVIFPEGLECTWDIQESVEKYYNFG